MDMSSSAESFYEEAGTMRLTRIGVSAIAALMCISGALLLVSAGDAGAATKGDQEALADAHEYLSTQPFSLKGLISQVEYDGFSTAEATYGAEHSRANWNKEGLLDAKDYLSTQAYSRSGLVGQLGYDGFTASQSSYGAAHCGANWNTEAYKDAKEYLSTQAFSLSGLVGQLKYDGFTAAQATYGAHKAY
jgi:hypothetical protein